MAWLGKDYLLEGENYLGGVEIIVSRLHYTLPQISDAKYF